MIITVSNSSTGRQTNFDQWDCVFTEKNPAILVNENKWEISLVFILSKIGWVVHAKGSKKSSILCVQEVVIHLMYLFTMGHYFLDILYEEK